MKAVAKHIEGYIFEELNKTNKVNSFFEKGLIDGQLSESKLSNSEYKFGKVPTVEWLTLEELGKRKRKLKYVQVGIPINIVEKSGRSIMNDALKYILGKVEEIDIEWSYNPDGELDIKVHGFTLSNEYKLEYYRA